MNTRTFVASWRNIGSMPEFSDEVIESEPMLFGASVDFARCHGGGITRNFLRKLPTEDAARPWMIDSRVHMLKAGWYPAIPGWHLDSIPRSKTNRQPDFAIDTSGLECVTAIIGGGSATEFLEPGSTINLHCRDGKRWAEFSREINSSILDGEIRTKKLDFGAVVVFGPNDFHRASPSTGDAWRCFFRATRSPWIRPEQGKIRKQTQVYLHELEAGWRMKIIGYEIRDAKGNVKIDATFTPDGAWAEAWRFSGSRLARSAWIAARKADGWRCHPVGEAVP